MPEHNTNSLILSAVKEKAPQYDYTIFQITDNSKIKTELQHFRNDSEVLKLPEEDDLFPIAVDIVLETGQGLVSTLQQRLKIGYKRAAYLMKQMENMGIVGPFEDFKPRQLLITLEQWQQIKSNL